MSEQDSKPLIQPGEVINTALPPKPGSWLDNPLPVPKRHGRREVTYAFEPEEEQMKYDLEVSEEDDFDL